MSKIEYRFNSKGLGPNESLIVVDFKGFESISSPYEFTINLKSESPEIDLEEMLNKRCTFEMEFDGEIKKFHGVLSVFDQLHQVGKYTLYQAVLVPQLWQLSLYQTNEIYLDMTVEDIIKAILEECDIPSLDCEFNLMSSYTKWPFRCQFGETHLQLISRLMEHQGIYYYFEQGDNAEKIIFCDNMQSQKPMKTPEVNYTPITGLDKHTVFDNIQSLVCRQNRLPKNLILRDYNYEKPSLDVEGSATIDDKGIGEVFNYGENFDTPEEGKQLAKARAEELACTKERFYGESAVYRFIPGYFFELKQHFRQNFNQEYLLISAEHEGKMPSHLSDSSSIPDYQNSFTAIPSGTQFRSKLNTAKPRFYGTINAVIDAEQEGEYAELDEQGRYKVLFPFDRVTEHEGGKASHWVRMAQPYGGSQEGMFFPLRKGTEVLLTFINGDPDQPVISAVVPNAANPCLVNADSQTSGRIRTSTGNLIEMEDKEGKNRIKLFSPKGNTYMHLGSSNPDGDGFVTMTTGLRRRDYLGGKQTTIITKDNTEDVPPSVRNEIDNAGQNTAGTSPTDTNQPNMVTEQDVWGFVKREIRSGHGNSADGTTVLTTEEEISGDYVIERVAGTRYSWASGHEFNYGTGNIYNFGNSLEVCHWNQNATDESKNIVDAMFAYELTGITEYGGGAITADSTGSEWETLLNKGQIGLTESDEFCAHNGNVYDFGGCWNYNLGNGYEENHMEQGQQEMNKKYEYDKSPAGPPDTDSYSVEHLESHKNNVGVSKTIKAPSYDYSTESPGVEVAHKCDSFSYTYGGVSKEWTYTSTGTKVSYEENDVDAGSSREETYSSGGGTMMCLNRTSTSGQNLSTEEFTMVASSELSLSLAATSAFSMQLGATSDISLFVGLESSIDLKLAGSLSVEIAAGMVMEVEANPCQIEIDPSTMKVKVPGMDVEAEIAALKVEQAAAVNVRSAAMELAQNAMDIGNKAMEISQKALNLESAQKISV